MKANEIMVGDYLRVNRERICIQKGTIVRVSEIDSENTFREKGLKGSAHCESMDDTWLSGGVWCDYLEPIPLTPEILEKNGFECVGKRKYYLIPGDPSLAIQRKPILGAHGNTFFIGHFIEKTIFQGFIELTYVHDLQHALRLCGIEKEIVL